MSAMQHFSSFNVAGLKPCSMSLACTGRIGTNRLQLQWDSQGPAQTAGS